MISNYTPFLGNRIGGGVRVKKINDSHKHEDCSSPINISAAKVMNAAPLLFRSLYVEAPPEIERKMLWSLGRS